MVGFDGKGEGPQHGRGADDEGHPEGPLHTQVNNSPDCKLYYRLGRSEGPPKSDQEVFLRPLF